MATARDKDAVTGTDTTGHEWDGIKELDTPLPKWWLNIFYVSIAFSIVWWFLYPSWPTLHSHSRGLLGNSQRIDLQERMDAAQAAQAEWLDKIKAADLATINSDPKLQQFAVAGGEKTFKNNCAACHGLGGAGQGNYPTLADDDWLWGGTLDDIYTTIAHGIRYADDPDTRDTQMPVFGDGVLTADQIKDVAQHVLAFTKRDTDAEGANRGAQIYADNCASCHGENGEGMPEMGAPRLNDQIWLYGGEPEQIIAQITKPHMGVMPAWGQRLDDPTRKMVTVYVHSLGGGQ
ncbi:MAG: cytochrome-c oxidase, cbb3-type subunit III [Geminicoccaceae bacterium]